MAIRPNKKQQLNDVHLIENILDDTRPCHFSMDNTATNLEDLTIVYIDTNINKNKDCLDTIERLRIIANNVQIFDNIHNCKQYLLSITNEKVFLIVSGSLSRTLIPDVHDLVIIELIYIFCREKDEHSAWVSFINHTKIRSNIFNDKTELLSTLAKDALTCTKNLLPPMGLFSLDANGKSIRDLNKEQATFMWNQILIEILLRMPIMEKTKDEMLNVCRQHYKNNVIELERINEFETTYTADKAIFWYTRDSFLYRLLNKAFRIDDIDIIFKFRFIIIDLFQQLKTLHRDFLQSSDTKYLTVYRGQRLSTSELKLLETNIEGLISLNTFLSTTTSSTIAAEFSGCASALETDEIKSVIFEMEIDMLLVDDTKRPYSPITNQSSMPNENEVLLSMGIVFRIDCVEQVNEKLWHIKLRSTNEADNQVKVLMDHLKDEIGKTTDLTVLGEFLCIMGEYDKSKRYYNLVLHEFNLTDNQKATINNDIGLVHYNTGDYIEALKYFENACSIYSLDQSINNKYLNAVQNNIGLVYIEQGNYSEALICFEKLLKLENIDDIHLALAYNNIGTTYEKMGNYSLAQKHHELALEIRMKLLPADHYDIAVSYGNLGLVYEHSGQYDKAIECYKSALQIRLKVLPPKHIEHFQTYNNLGSVYAAKEEYKEALNYYELALETYLKSKTTNELLLALLYNNTAMVYEGMNNSSAALTNYRKALKLRREKLPMNHPDIGSVYHNIGNIYLDRRKFHLALKYFNKTLKIYHRCLESNHPDLAITYNSLGTLFGNKSKYKKALYYFNKALIINLQTLPANHIDLAQNYQSIANIYYMKRNKKMARLNYIKALEVQSTTHSLDTIDIYNKIGLTYKDEGNTIDALNWCNKALDMLLKDTLEQSTESALPETYINIASIYKKIGTDDKALENYRKALEIIVKADDLENQSNLLIIYMDIGEIYMKKKQYKKAKKIFINALKLINNDEFKTNHVLLPTVQYNLGIIYEKNAKYKLALRYFKNSNMLFKLLNKSGNINVAKTYVHIGCLYETTGNYEQAIQYLKYALETGFHELEPYHSLVITTIKDRIEDIRFSLNSYQTTESIHIDSL
jgi:tetratricopeptide (TPR) repeat protein